MPFLFNTLTEISSLAIHNIFSLLIFAFEDTGALQYINLAKLKFIVQNFPIYLQLEQATEILLQNWRVISLKCRIFLKSKFIETEKIGGCQKKGGGVGSKGMGEMGESGQKVQTSSCKFWGCNIMVTVVSSIVYLKVDKE